MKPIIVAALGLAALTLATPALAGTRDDVLFGISRCGGISDDRAWLDCLYGAAQPMRAQLGLMPAPASQQKLVPPAMPGLAAPASSPAVQAMAAPPARAEPIYKPNFIERMMTPKDYKAEPPTTLASYKFDGAGYFTVTLATGETWKQDSGDTTLAHWDKPARNYPVQVVMRSPSESRLRIGAQLFIVHK